MGQNNILIIGAGGNSRVAISVLRQTNEWNIQGIIDTDYKGQTEAIMGVSVIGGEEKLTEVKTNYNNVFVAIGDNKQRRLWYEKLTLLGYNTPTIVSDLAYVDPSARLGKGNLLCAYSYVGPECVIGDNNILNTRSNLEHESSVEDHSHLAPSITTGGRCRIGSEVLIGAGSIILPKVEIPGNTVIGANSLVIDSLTTNGTYIGSPVRKIK